MPILLNFVTAVNYAAGSFITFTRGLKSENY